MSDADPCAIVRSLGAAQKRVLLGLPADVNLARRVPGKEAMTLYGVALERLVRSVGNGSWWHVTPLGLAVRALLEEARDE